MTGTMGASKITDELPGYGQLVGSYSCIDRSRVQPRR